MIVGHVASEDLHRADTEAEGEERLVHRGDSDVAESGSRQTLKAGQQVERRALRGVGQHQAVHGKDDDQHEQAGHHHLRDLFQPLAHAEGKHKEAADDRDRHHEPHLFGIAQHRAENGVNFLELHPVERSRRELDEIRQHPAGNGRVEHHQHVVAEHTGPAVQLPGGRFGLEHLVRADGALTAGASHSKLHAQHRQPKNGQKQQIDQHEQTAAVLSHQPRELPHVADADGTAGADEQESSPRLKTLTFHVFPNSFASSRTQRETKFVQKSLGEITEA